jgi:predicted metal-dependent hydrolase
LRRGPVFDKITLMDAGTSEILSLPGGPARVEWRRSSRARHVSLRIDPRDGAVVVTLPPRAGRTAGMALLMDHADWVSRRLAALPGAVPFAEGAAVPLDGEPHHIRHVGRVAAAGRRGSVWIEGGEILVAGDAEFLARRVADFLRSEARRRLSVLVARKAALAEVRPHRVVVKDTRSRWGSCAIDRTLAFSWRLVMAPRFVQDYVVAHEIAHLRHMNHGTRFWGLVDSLTPHTATAVAWLRAQGPRLLRIG